MWIFEQSTGLLYDRTGKRFAQGYAGHGLGKNNPAMQNVRGCGPLPVGIYTPQAPFDSPDHGKFAMRLVPDAGVEEFGRAGFMMHGDSIEHPGEASEGCIVQPRFAREAVWASREKVQVVAHIEDWNALADHT